MSKLIQCKVCDNEIAKGVKKCPHCGKDQRNWFMRHKIMTFFGGLILIIMFSVMASSGDEEASTVGEAEESKEKEEVYQIGDEVEVDGLKYTIVQVEDMDEMGDVEFLGKEASEGGTLVGVQYKVENISDEPIGAFSYPSFKLLDESGTEYNSDVDASSSYAVETNIDNSKILSDLNPGITVDGTDAFEVSKEKYGEGEWFIQIGKTIIQIK